MSDAVQDTGKILIYQTEQGETKIDVYFEDGTVWLTQKNIAELYQTTPQNITLHIKNIYADGELTESATCKDSLQVQTEGIRQIHRTLKIYNFDMILAIGYRVRSTVGIHFRRWATNILTEYTQKGFALNDDRLKNPKEFGADYFDELLERIRDIRASEKRFYQKVKDIFTLSVDYDAKSPQAQEFFKTVQNKLEFAATGHTAPEIIASRADATKDNMGLTSFKGAKVRKSDVTVAKNYLTQDEIAKLNLIVTMYLDHAELMASTHHEMHMSDWEDRLSAFLQFNGQEDLKNAGQISSEVAKKLALKEYEKYDSHRKKIEAADLDALENDVKNLKS